MQNYEQHRLSAAPNVLSEERMYSYEPLETRSTVRVLKLKRGSGDDPLRGELRHVDMFPTESCQRLGTNPSSESEPSTYGTFSYEAISYVWGAPVFSCSIHCVTGKISLTSNLETALRTLRLPDRDRVIWVDAICIDQSNTAERGHQVKLMGQIYANAERVLIWLGPDPLGLARPVRSDKRPKPSFLGAGLVMSNTLPHTPTEAVQNRDSMVESTAYD